MVRLVFVKSQVEILESNLELVMWSCWLDRESMTRDVTTFGRGGSDLSAIAMAGVKGEDMPNFH